MANDAGGTPLGTVIDMESCRTLSRASAEARTLPKIPSGPAGSVTAPSGTEDSSLPLSAAEHLRLIRILEYRRQGFMASMTDYDFLLELLERVTR